MSLAKTQAGKQNYAEAIRILQEHLREDSASIRPYLDLASYYRCNLQTAQGTRYFDQLSKTAPSLFQADLALALLAGQEEQWSQCRQHSKDALERGCSHPLGVQLLVESSIKSKNTGDLPSVLARLKRRESQGHLFDLGYAYWRYEIGNLVKARATVLNYLEEYDNAYAHKLLGDIYSAEADFKNAQAQYLLAKARSDDAGYELKYELLRQMAANSVQLGNLDSTNYYYNLALRETEFDGMRYERLRTYKAATDFFSKNSRPQQLLTAAHGGIEVCQQLRLGERLPEFYYWAAYANQSMGNNPLAQQYYRLASAKARESGQELIQIKAMIEEGRLEMTKSDWPSAMRIIEQAYEMARTSADHEILEHEALLHLGDINGALNNTSEARDAYHKVLRFAQNRQHHELTEICFLKLAQLYLTSEQDIENASYYLTMAEYLAKQTFKLQLTANLRWLNGRVAMLEHDIEQSETLFLKAIQLGKDMGSYMSILAGHSWLIKTYLEAGFLDFAAARADSALEFLAEFGSLSFKEHTSEFFDVKEELIIPAIQAYSVNGDLVRIYRAIEIYKTFEEVERLANLGFTMKTTTPGADIKRRIDDLEQVVMRRWGGLLELLGNDDTGDSLIVIAETREEIRRLVAQRQELRRQLADAHPDYHNLFYASFEQLDRLRKKLSGQHAALVHYLIGKESAHLLLVKADSIYYQPLNVEQEVLRSMAVHARAQNRTNNGAWNWEASGSLYDLLFKPIAPRLPGETLLFISPDDCLEGIPLESFVSNVEHIRKTMNINEAEFLIQDYSFSYISSARLLSPPRRLLRPPTKSIIAMAVCNDPDKEGAEANGWVAGNSKERKEKEDEIRELVETIGDRRSRAYYRNEVTPDLFVDESPQYKITHLETDTRFGASSPLYNSLAFSDHDSAGTVFHTFEFFNQNLNSALLLLQSRNGFPAESIDGLQTFVHAVHYAGIPALLTNLWSDQPGGETSKLLKFFYENIKSGMTKSEALRQAKLSFIAKVNRTPDYWASYILFGDTDTISFDTQKVDYLIALTMLGVIGLMAFVFWQVSKMRRERNL